MIPTQPQNLLPSPFAQSGTKSVIPAEQPNPGRASFSLGFPEETQLPLNMGGIAPNRMDFNGMFYMLSAFAFWQQSGGMFNYNAALNYSQPSLVFHNKKLWWCMAANGPEVSGVGAKTPGSSETYWMEFLKALDNMSGNAIGKDMTPVGTVITYYGATAPAGYFACNGGSFSATTYPKLRAVLGKSTLPDLRGYFIRGYDTRNTVDPNGATRAIGSVQNFAMQNITGSVISNGPEPVLPCDSTDKTVFNGALYNKGGSKSSTNSAIVNAGGGYFDLYFDASRAVKTSTETRPANVCLLYCIKHD